MIRCAIIDDEPLSRDVLRQFISDHPDLFLAGEYKDALESINGLKTNPRLTAVGYQSAKAFWYKFL